MTFREDDPPVPLPTSCAPVSSEIHNLQQHCWGRLVGGPGALFPPVLLPVGVGRWGAQLGAGAEHLSGPLAGEGRGEACGKRGGGSTLTCSWGTTPRGAAPPRPLLSPTPPPEPQAWKGRREWETQAEQGKAGGSQALQPRGWKREAAGGTRSWGAETPAAPHQIYPQSHSQLLTINSRIRDNQGAA